MTSLLCGNCSSTSLTYIDSVFSQVCTDCGWVDDRPTFFAPEESDTTPCSAIVTGGGSSSGYNRFIAPLSSLYGLVSTSTTRNKPSVERHILGTLRRLGCESLHSQVSGFFDLVHKGRWGEVVSAACCYVVLRKEGRRWDVSTVSRAASVDEKRVLRCLKRMILEGVPVQLDGPDCYIDSILPLPSEGVALAHAINRCWYPHRLKPRIDNRLAAQAIATLAHEAIRAKPVVLEKFLPQKGRENITERYNEILNFVEQWTKVIPWIGKRKGARRDWLVLHLKDVVRFKDDGRASMQAEVRTREKAKPKEVRGLEGVLKKLEAKEVNLDPFKLVRGVDVAALSGDEVDRLLFQEGELVNYLRPPEEAAKFLMAKNACKDWDYTPAPAKKRKSLPKSKAKGITLKDLETFSESDWSD